MQQHAASQKAVLANGKHSTVWCLFFLRLAGGWHRAADRFCLVVSGSAAEPTLFRTLQPKVAYFAFVRLFWDARETKLHSFAMSRRSVEFTWFWLL